MRWQVLITIVDWPMFSHLVAKVLKQMDVEQRPWETKARVEECEISRWYLRFQDTEALDVSAYNIEQQELWPVT